LLITTGVVADGEQQMFGLAVPSTIVVLLADQVTSRVVIVSLLCTLIIGIYRYRYGYRGRVTISIKYKIIP